MTSTPWTADDLVAKFDEVRSHTERLAAPLSPEDQTVQSMPDVSPTKWHRAHVTWFFETFVLADHEQASRRSRTSTGSSSTATTRRSARATRGRERGVISRPGAHDVGVYRGNVDARMRDLVSTLDEGTLGKLAGTIELGFHHEQQHQELLLMDIKHVLSLNPLQPVLRRLPEPGRRPGPARLGRRRGRARRDRATGVTASPSTTSCRCHQVHLRAVPAGRPTGHQRGVARVHGRRRLPEAGAVALRRLGAGAGRGLGGAVLLGRGRRRLVRAHPARHLAGQPGAARLARQPLRGGRLRRLGRQAAPDRGRVGARRSRRGPRRRPATSPTRRPSTPRAGRPADGTLRQAYGDCWEWTSSAYLPYPGFHPAAGAIGEYNGKFMSNQMVLRGGCALTSPGHTRASYRNFFPPGARWALSGVRLADGGAPRSAA